MFKEVVRRAKLSISAIKLSELKSGKRIDSEYYTPDNLRARRDVVQSRFDVKPLGELSKSIINFGAYSLCNFIVFQDEGVPYLTARDIGENLISWDTTRYISEEQHKDLLWKSQISKN